MRILAALLIALPSVLCAETLPPLLCTFAAESGAVGGRWWKGGGEHTWNRVAAAGSSALVLADGTPSAIALTCQGTLCGAPGVLTAAQFPNRAKDFPQGMTTGSEHGYVLNQDGGGCAFTLSGLDPRATYTLSVLAGRGNAWRNVASVYAVEGATLAYAENAAGAVATLTQNTDAGAWLVFAVTFSGRDAITVSSSGGTGNFNAFALEGEAPDRWQWANPDGGEWADPANWANAEVGGDPWFRDLPDAAGEVVVAYAPASEPAALRCDATATAYVLRAGAFACAFKDGTVRKDGPGAVRLTSMDSEADFRVLAGTLCLDGATSGTVAVAPGAAFGGQGQAAAVRFAEGAVLDPTLGAPQADAATVDVADLLPDSLPVGASAPSPTTTVTVRVEGVAPGRILACPAIDPALRFLPADRLEVRPDGLWLLPPPTPGYRLGLR